ncbi:MAG: sigma-70 family RNA polymerase sigma factor [Bacteroidia bacterium]|nr:sigma-70 family RNA polymerase sigma factor [Bacteroidia bacterium]
MIPINATMAAEQNRLLEETIQRERRRLLEFIRKRIPQEEDPEDVLQDVFTELAESLRMERVIDRVSGWVYRVARNKIADLFRRRRTESLEARYENEYGDGEEGLGLNDLLPDPAGGPEAEYARRVIMSELMLALDELPEEQRWVFWENEIEERSFRELAEEAGVSLNTLLSRKRYAVLFLRERLKELYNELGN